MKVKQWQSPFLVIVNGNSIVQYIIQNKNKTCQYECKNCNISKNISAKKVIVGILVHVFVRIAII